jgi:hypothetical protein
LAVRVRFGKAETFGPKYASKHRASADSAPLRIAAGTLVRSPFVERRRCERNLARLPPIERIEGRLDLANAPAC